MDKEMYSYIEQMEKMSSNISFKYIKLFIAGYEYYYKENGIKSDFMRGFQELVQMRKGIYVTDIHWSRIIEFYNVHDKWAVNDFFRIYREYMEIRRNGDIDGFIEKYNKECNDKLKNKLEEILALKDKSEDEVLEYFNENFY